MERKVEDDGGWVVLDYRLLVDYTGRMPKHFRTLHDSLCNDSIPIFYALIFNKLGFRISWTKCDDKRLEFATES